MNKNIIIKSLLNGIISFFLVALVLDLVRGIPFGKAIVDPYNIFIGVAAIIGSYIGFTRKALKQ
ncbi:MAG: hypothetical protein Q4C10_05710 [Clostridia bacterium]|nr:hypothetical protein [Clostridia bacterium]